jgi:hypothetical protein
MRRLVYLFVRHFARAVRAAGLIFTFAINVAAYVLASDRPAENPIATQFRKHLEDADQNKDGFVTAAELSAEISKDHKRDAHTVEDIASGMMRDLDTDHDGKLSATEIAEGARKLGQNSTIKQNIGRAQLVMEAIAGYKENHGRKPTKLDELVELQLIPDTALRCIVADGHEKLWGYEPSANDQHAVMLFSPGPIDSEGQYVVGLANGRVLGLHGADLELEKVPRLKMHVYPNE